MDQAYYFSNASYIHVDCYLYSLYNHLFNAIANNNKFITYILNASTYNLATLVLNIIFSYNTKIA